MPRIKSLYAVSRRRKQKSTARACFKSWFGKGAASAAPYRAYKWRALTSEVRVLFLRISFLRHTVSASPHTAPATMSHCVVQFPVPRFLRPVEIC
jgi:hypothetical protein